MPFYNINNMEKSRGEANASIQVSSAIGEFMKVAIMTEQEGEGPPLHEHANEEQFSLILKDIVTEQHTERLTAEKIFAKSGGMSQPKLNFLYNILNIHTVL